MHACQQEDPWCPIPPPPFAAPPTWQRGATACLTVPPREASTGVHMSRAVRPGWVRGLPQVLSPAQLCTVFPSPLQVYLEPHQLGVAPLLTSWLAALPAHYPVRPGCSAREPRQTAVGCSCLLLCSPATEQQHQPPPQRLWGGPGKAAPASNGCCACMRRARRRA